MSREPGLVARWRARRAYFAADAEARQACADFMTTDPAARREALLWEADCERTMAATAFGWRDRFDEDGFTLGQSHGWTAVLLAMVADTELAPGTPWRHVWRSELDDDPKVVNVLATLAQATDPNMRAVLTMALYEAVIGRVGGHAAEALAAGVARRYYQLSGLPGLYASWLTGPHRPGRS